MLRKRTLKKESKGLQRRSATVSKQEEQRPHYEEIQVQNYHVYHTLEPNAWIQRQAQSHVTGIQ